MGFQDFSINMEDECPQPLKWNRKIETVSNTPCFNEVRI